MAFWNIFEFGMVWALKLITLRKHSMLIKFYESLIYVPEL